MSKEYIKIALAYVGVIVGAGLSSGQDILQYFLSFGKKGIIGVILLGVLNVIFGRIMLTLGSYYQSDNHQDVLGKIAGPVMNKLIDLTLIIAAFVMGFVMVAGAGANLNQQFGIPAWTGALICSVLIVIVAYMDFNKITAILGIFTPVIIVMILMVTAYTFIGKKYDFGELDLAAKTIEPAVSNLWLSVINYFSLCAMTGVSMAFVLGGSIVRIGTAEKGGLLGGSLIGLIITCASLTLFANIAEVKSMDIPMLEIMKEIHPAIAFVYTLVIFALIFNTAFSLYYATAKRFGKGNMKRTRIIMIGIVAAGYLCSFGGFKALIGYLYPILGYMGVLLLVLLSVTWIRKKEFIKEEKYLRRHMIRLFLKQVDKAKKLTHRERKILHQLSEASAADASALREEVKNYTAQLSENVEDVVEFAEEHLPVRMSTSEYVEQILHQKT